MPSKAAIPASVYSATFFRLSSIPCRTGYVDFSGDMDFCITIRTMIKKGREVYLQAGAGIVADSVPEKEYQECCNKVMALARTLLEEENL